MSWHPFLLAASVAAAHLPAQPTPGEVGQAIAERRARVEEFRLVKEAAAELGVRVWLFGGTAAGFAHYVRWDLLREGGDSRYRDSHFDYDFTNIYRSTQDADLVVDATPEQAEQLESLIREKMSFLQGSKDHWEVRLLRHDRRTPGGQVKQALLHNPDFLGQNTDSNSTGMVELTDPPPGEEVVRDLRDWESPKPFFLEDVTAGRLHYYRSPTHRTTSRFLAGENPEIFSVLRYLVKAFQYDLKVDGDDLVQIQGIIDAFDPARDFAALDPWAQGWLERYGPNLVRHAVNIEYAWNTLESLGLRAKLLALSDPAREGSLGWWLSREPLRTRPLGTTGRTAAELGITTVAHETSDFLAYESIIRDTTLRPNVLISRQGRRGEMAAHGDGFYTLKGRHGAKGTGLTIRFAVDPAAREGADFTVQDGVVLFTNRAALRVIPESLEISTVQYFEMLRDGLQADPTDRGIWAKLKRKLAIRPLLPADEEKVLAMVREAVAHLPGPKEFDVTDFRPVLREWFQLNASLQHPELVNDLIEAGRDAAVAQRVLSRPGWSAHPELVRLLLRRGHADDELIRYVLGDPQWDPFPDLTEARQRIMAELFRLGRLWLVPLVLRENPWAMGRVDLLLELMRLSIEVSHSKYSFMQWVWAIDQVVAMPAWRDNPQLRALCGGADPTVECLREVVGEERSRAEAATIAAGMATLSGSSAPGCP